MQLKKTLIEGCVEIQPPVFQDDRGSFVKVFRKSVFRELGLSFDYTEEFYSVTRPGVIRGMHFQTPPEDHDKVVSCVQGRALDVVIDLRKHSPSYRKIHAVELTSENPILIYIPRGLAHGFLALGESDCILLYRSTVEYAPKYDLGIRWDSFGFVWPVKNPVLSDRDKGFPMLKDFKNPF